MIVYRARSNMTKPEPVECVVPGYPNRDANGETMYENTHFVNESDAWTRLEAERRAHVRIAGDRVSSAKYRLREAEQLAGEAAELFSEFVDNATGWFQGGQLNLPS